MTTTDAVTARHVVHTYPSAQSAQIGTDRPGSDRGRAGWTRTRRSPAARSGGRGLGLLAAALLGTVVAGCGSTNLLGPSDTPTQATGPAVLPVQEAQAPSSRSRLAIAPVMGAPEGVSKQVGSQLGSALERQRVSIIQAADRPDYTLRGYMVATPEKGRTKVAYIFDLTDSAGKRVNRIQGEEVVQGTDARDSWSVVSPEVTQRITDKTAGSLATALASLGTGGSGGPGATAGAVGSTGSTGSTGASGGVGGTTPIASTSGGAVPAAGTAAASVAAATPAVTPSGAGGPVGGTTRVAAVVPAVTGAPGDGNDSLSNAMRQELQQAGIGSATAGQRGAYSVAGRVTMGPVKEGKQSIKIDWRVTDPAGTLLATVSQNNDIQAGSLDGPWGNIAGDAAQGAAQRIRQLIDEREASAGAAARTKSAQRTRG
jgi:hypothetical protein